ncbi:MAG: hypothetical protein AAGA53_13545 [Pseudomonadota bacterium]
MLVRLKSLFLCISVLVFASLCSAQAKDLTLLKENESIHREFRVEPIISIKEPIVLVIEQELTEFLRLAGKFNGYEIHFSSDVSGTLKDASLPMNIHKLMPELGNVFDLQWHIGRSKLFVSKASIKSTRYLDLKGLDLDQLEEEIARTDINPDSFNLEVLKNQESLRVVGPASYIDGIAAIANALRESDIENE